MSLTYSQPMPLSMLAPRFQLPDAVSDKILSLDNLKSEHATVIMFICNHCPFVQHIAPGIARVATDYSAKGVAFIAISANDVENYPEDAPPLMKQNALELGYSFPYLYDESQQVAKDYGAQCTPEFYVFDKQLRCTYHGRFDDSTPGKPIPVTGKDLRTALDATLVGKSVSEQHPSVGCNIKWKE